MNHWYRVEKLNTNILKTILESFIAKNSVVLVVLYKTDPMHRSWSPFWLLYRNIHEPCSQCVHSVISTIILSYSTENLTSLQTYMLQPKMLDKWVTGQLHLMKLLNISMIGQDNNPLCFTKGPQGREFPPTKLSRIA